MSDENLSMIEEANKAAARLEAANREKAELLKKEEALRVRAIVGGQANAGEQKVEMSQEEKDRIDTKLYFKGTAIEAMLK